MAHTISVEINFRNSNTNVYEELHKESDEFI